MARIQVVTRNATDTGVLLQLRGWIKQKRENNGHDGTAVFLVKLAKKTGFSFDQTKRSVARLRNLDLITSSQHLFDGKNVNLYELTELGERLCFGNGDDLGPAPSEQCKSAPLEQGKSAPLFIQGDKSGKNGSEKTGSPSLASDFLSGEEKGTGGDEGVAQDSIPVHKEEGIGAGESKSYKPGGVQALKVVWLEAIRPYFRKKPPMSMMAKQLAQLKQFMQACPAGKAEEILKRVIPEWTKFTNRVEQDAGYKGAPYAPSIGFLAQFAQIAADFGLPSQAIFTVPASEKIRPVQVIGPKPEPAAEDDFDPDEYYALPPPKPSTHGLTKEQLMAPHDPTNVIAHVASVMPG